MFLSDESNRTLADLIARGDLVAVQDALVRRRTQTEDETRWLELSADLVKVFVQQSRYREAEEIVLQIERQQAAFSLKKRGVTFLSVLLCFAHAFFPKWATVRMTRLLARISGYPSASTYVLDSLLWGVFWQDLLRAQGYTLLMCFTSRSEEERYRAFAMLSYCLLIRGWEFLGYRGLLKVLSQSESVSTKAYIDTYFWIGISNRWRSRKKECLHHHARFESLFPQAEGFYRIISDSSRLQLAVAEMGPSEVLYYYGKCASETISMKHGRHQIHLRGARACLAGLSRNIPSLETNLAEAKNVANRVANTLDEILLAWLSTIAYLNAGLQDKAALSYQEFRQRVERYGSPKLFRQELARIGILLRHKKANSMGHLVSSLFYLIRSFSMGPLHRFPRAVRHVANWMRDGQTSYWSTASQLTYFVEKPQEQDAPDQFIDLFTAVSEELSKMATRLDEQSMDLGEVISIIERTFETKEVIVGEDLNTLIDQIRNKQVLLNSLVRNEDSHTVRVPTKDGRIFIGVEGSDRLSDESLAIGVLVDRSKFKEESSDLIAFSLGTLIRYFFLMKEIKRVYRQQEEAQRNHAIAETARMLAHDIRQPFSMLRAMIHALSKLSSTEEMRAFSDRNLPNLVRSIQSVEAMVSDIIEFGRPASFQAQPFSSFELLENALTAVFDLESKSHIQLEYDLNVSHKLQGDFNKCSRLFSNILGNASTILQATHSPRIWIRARETAGNLTEFTIGNNGPPIPSEDLKQIFAPFFTRNKKEGTGLGLAIAKKVVESHGGTIRCESNETSTEFIFTLPTSEVAERERLLLPALARDFGQRIGGPAKPEVLLANPAQEAALLKSLLSKFSGYPRTLHLLVVDDEPGYRLSLEKLVTSEKELSHRIRYFEAGTYSEAMELLAREKFDLIICDIDLKDPNQDGLDVVSKAREAFPKAEICVHSNRYLAGDSKRALTAGADSFFPKPMSKEHFLKLLASWIERQDFRPEQETTRPRIAIVDDDPLLRDCWQVILKENFEVLAYDSPKSFLEHKPDVETLACVITDYDFGNVKNAGSALELARILRSQDAGLPVILASGYDLSDSRDFTAVVPKADIQSKDAILRLARLPGRARN